MDDGLHLFTIYENPTDYPGLFVVRESIVEPMRTVLREPPLAVVLSLEDARASVPPGLVRMTRADEDEPAIVEVWF